MKQLLLLLQCVCLLGSGVLLAKPIYQLGKRKLHQIQARSVWETYKDSNEQSHTSGAPATWLRIPGAGIGDLVLLEDTESNLARHPCLAQDDPKVILGHRDTHFRNLKQVQIEEVIELEDRSGQIHLYQVTDIEVLPAEQAATRIHEHRDPDSLILMTCYPFTYIGNAPDRYLVWARPLKE